MSEAIKKLTAEDGQSKDLVAENIEKLKQLFPEVVTEGKIDFEVLQEVLGEFKEESNERYSFTWNGKSQARKLAMTPSRGTLRPAPEESVNWDTTENLFIEGDNLEVLKLLQRSYHNKVKMIYIDPPYNTGNDFVYADDFKDNLKNYFAQTNQIDVEGHKFSSNPETSGRYHTDWLNMMFPRLKLARELLSKEGVILVSIDDHELATLKLVMNEVFGEECFKNCIIFKRGIKSVQAQFETIDSLAVGHEYLLMYSENANYRFPHLKIERDEYKHGDWNNHWRGTDRPTMRYELFGITPEEGQWRWGKDRSYEAIENFKQMVRELGKQEGVISQEEIDDWWQQKLEEEEVELDLLRLSAHGKPEHYIPPSNEKLGSDLWTDLSPRGSSELKRLFGKKVFDNPKPTGLIERILSFLTESDNEHIILDFFAGSSSTAHAVLKKNVDDEGNRRFIMVQLPEALKKPKKSSDKIFHTIADISKERIRLVINELQEQTNSDIDLGFKVFKLDTSNIKPWDPNFDEVQLSLEDSIENIKPGRTEEDVLYEILLKYGLDLALPIEERTIDGAKVFVGGAGAIVLSLSDNITLKVVEGIAAIKNEYNPEIMRVVFRDSGFKDDVVKTNAVQILKQNGIEDIRSI